jgi:hypothetical protein
MAVAVSKMNEDEFGSIVATDAPDFSSVVASEEDFEARVAANPWITLMGQVRKELSKGGKKPSFAEVAAEAKKRWAEKKKEEGKDKKADDASAEKPAEEVAPAAPEVPEEKKEAEWTKEASDAVAQALIAEVCEDKQAGKIKGPGKPDGTGPWGGTPQCQMAPKETPETPKVPEKPEPVEAKKEEPKAPEAPKVPDEPVEAKKEAPKAPEAPKAEPEVKKEEPKPVEQPKEAEVDTSILTATENFEDIELSHGLMTADELGNMTAEEQNKLASVMKFDVTQGLSKTDLDKLNSLLR